MKNISGAVKISVGFVAVLWIVFFIDFLFPADLRILGLRPRDTGHLWGILAAPLLHGNLDHLVANTGALLVLMAVCLSFSRKLAYKALFIIWILGGALVWFFASGNTVHIGASGIIFGLIGFLLFVGIFRKEAVALACSLVVFFLYGGSLLSLLSYVPGVSWSGHFFGFVSGVTAAWATKGTRSS